MRRNLFIVFVLMASLAGVLMAVSVASASTVQITAPTTGEVLWANADYEIKWTATGNISQTKIYYSSDGGATWSLQGTQDYTTGSYAWKVPATATTTGRIRVEVVEVTLGGGFPPSISMDTFHADTGNFTIMKMVIKPSDPVIPMVTKPASPSELGAVLDGGDVMLSWKDNSNNESGFFVHRKEAGGSGYTSIKSLAANTTSCIDTGLTAGKTYYYVVTAYNSAGSSAYSNEAGVSLPAGAAAKPAAPTLNYVTASSETRIDMGWTDNASNESGVFIYRKAEGDVAYTKIADTGGPDWTGYGDDTVMPGTTYYYYVEAYNSAGSAASNVLSAKTPGTPPLTEPPVTPSEGGQTSQAGNLVDLRFYIGQGSYYINDVLTPMDTSPMILEGRTMLPVRYVATPLGATVSWDPGERKVTVNSSGSLIELWINKNKARVNGEEKLIDPANPAVCPVIMPPGRTMLPLRFIAENLGCQVKWNGTTREARITYPKP